MKSLYWLLAVLLVIGTVGAAVGGTYPPVAPPADTEPLAPNPPSPNGLIYSNNHVYVSIWGTVEILVEVFDNYLGDFTKYHWVYTVKNLNYEPLPGLTNGFSGFETVLPAAVPDINDISAPDGTPPWTINGFSGSPVEWDLRNSDGAGVGGGTLPGQTESYSFTTLPRLIVQSTGWFHTWRSDFQDFIFNYPNGEGVEVPDVISEPGQELCCSRDATGAYICQVRPVGECASIGGFIVANCNECPPVVGVEESTWGRIKGLYRNQ